MDSLGTTHSKNGDHFMKVQFVSSRANSWNGAADSIIETIGKKNIKRGQLLWIDAHNNGKNEAAIFVAFFDMNSPGTGDLQLKYDVQNTQSLWNSIYTEASKHAESVSLEDVISITGSCNSNDHSVCYVFSQMPSTKIFHCNVQFVEARGSFKCSALPSSIYSTVAEVLIEDLASDGAQNGQIISIDAHNSGEWKCGMLSAFWSPDLPATGPLSIDYKFFSGVPSSWASLYGNCVSACNELKRNDFISITASIDTPSTSVIFLFHYT